MSKVLDLSAGRPLNLEKPPVYRSEDLVDERILRAGTTWFFAAGDGKWRTLGEPRRDMIGATLLVQAAGGGWRGLVGARVVLRMKDGFAFDLCTDGAGRSQSFPQRLGPADQFRLEVEADAGTEGAAVRAVLHTVRVD